MPRTPEEKRAAKAAAQRAYRARKKAAGETIRYPNRPETLRRYNLRRDYNMTPEEYDAILEEQGGVCFICEEPPGEQRLSIDHDHRCCPTVRQRKGGGTCGRCTRGLLCFRCNRALGGFGDDLARIERAAAYLRRDTLGGGDDAGGR